MSFEDIIDIYHRFYGEKDQKLLATILIHSELVARKAIECLEKFPQADSQFAYEAALLHDIGVVRCHAPSIGAFGSEPYLRHGLEGRKMLEETGLPKHALVCERHTGSGLTCNEIIEGNLPLPARDMLPLSLEEKAVCYADSFFSKSGDIRKEKSFDKVLLQMRAHGPETERRFLDLHALFS